MKKLLLTLSLSVLFLTIGYTQNPTFTGNAAADFMNTPGHQFFHDFPNDVGLPNGAPVGTVSGWDIYTAFFVYDDVADDLYVGIDFGGIFSDADGNGNPSTCDLWLDELDGIDHPDLSNTEGFVLAFDNGNDDIYDIYVGVSRMGDITEFGLYEYTSSMDVAPDEFSARSVGSVILHSDVFDMNNPDLEFVIEDISNYVDEICDVNFAIFAGSYEDGPIGEDHLHANLNFCGSLPVSFTGFLSSAKGRRVQLDWNLATETNNDYFEIQHATDANGAFKTIGRVDGSGTTNAPTAYAFYHDTPVKGNNYYRIKQVDFDGIVWYSWVITEEYKGGDGSTIEIYPNPNRGEFMLGLPAIVRDTEAFIKIMDATGKTILEENTSLRTGLTSYPIDVKGLPEGYYYVSLALHITGNTYTKGFFVK